MKKILSNRTILFVSDQQMSRDFYSAVLALEPTLDVLGMTEFTLSESSILGLMPDVRIARIICPALPDPSDAVGYPRCEIYLEVAGIENFIGRAREVGALEVSPLADRDWGHRAAYFADPDGNVLAFAEQIQTEI